MKLFVTFSLVSIYLCPWIVSSYTPLLLLAFDHFNWDLVDLYRLTHLQRLSERAVRVLLATDHSNLVHSAMFTGFVSDKKTRSDPIWLVHPRSALIGWTHGDLPSADARLGRYVRFPEKTSLDVALQQTMDWFEKSLEPRIDFAAVFYPEPAHSCTSNFSKCSKIDECDRAIGSLLHRLEKNHSFNLIVTSMRYEQKDTILYATGPAFRHNISSESLRSVDVHRLLLFLLDSSETPSEGSLERSRMLLRHDLERRSTIDDQPLTPSNLIGK
jgi:hypothetical protein